MLGEDWASHKYPKRGLQYLLARHKIDPGEAHRANADVHAALELLKRKGKNGVSYFNELINNPPLYDGIKIHKANLKYQAEKETAEADQQIATTKVKSTSDVLFKSQPVPKPKAAGCLSVIILPILLIALFKTLA